MGYGGIGFAWFVSGLVLRGLRSDWFCAVYVPIGFARFVSGLVLRGLRGTGFVWFVLGWNCAFSGNHTI